MTIQLPSAVTPKPMMPTDFKIPFLNVSEQRHIIGIVCILVASMVVTGCGDINSDTPTLTNDSLNASQQRETNDAIAELYGTYEAFETLTISFDNSMLNFIDINYYLEDMKVGSQRAWVDENGDYSFPVLPIAYDQAQELDVYVNGSYYGALTLLPLPALSSAHQAGEYSLTVANSILYGLREELDKLQSQLDDTEAMTDNVDKRIKTAFLADAIAGFQLLVSALDDVVVFNSPIMDDEEVILSGEALDALDRLYQQLFTRTVQHGMFLDANEVPISFDDDTDTSRIGDTALFDGFYLRAYESYSSLDGIRALSSLASSSSTETGDALQIIAGSMLPAIAAQGVEISDQPTIQFLKDSVELLRPNEVSNVRNSKLYQQSHATLEKLVGQLEIIESTSY